nr:hypothetical protein [Cronobacter turicensis]
MPVFVREITVKKRQNGAEALFLVRIHFCVNRVSGGVAVSDYNAAYRGRRRSISCVFYRFPSGF